MSTPLQRSARIVLVSPDGALLGALPAVPTTTPWWQDIGPVVQAAREIHGVDITVLRLLAVGEEGPSGIEVTYLAETAADLVAEPWDGVLDEHPLRLPYAKPGGPAADLAWAEEVLTTHGHVCTGPTVQVRTWNLSSVWRIPVLGQTLWLKVVPPFFAHEGAVIRALAGSPVPKLIDCDGSRVLIEEIAGVDLYDAQLPALLRMVGILVEIQRAWFGRVDDLIRLGLPDWRWDALAPALKSVIARNAAQFTSKETESLHAFIAGLPARFAALDACGLPPTLVHSDFAPGNFRGYAEHLTLLDWGDSGIGHPLFDQAAFFDTIPLEFVEEVSDYWNAAWRAAAPGSDPEKASILLAPIGVARKAVIYQSFLDHIEPSEHPYHRADPVDWLQRTAVILRSEEGS